MIEEILRLEEQELPEYPKEKTVVNIRSEPYTVYIGRRGRGHDGYFGNPFSIGQTCSRCGEQHQRGGTIRCFEEYARERIAQDPECRKRVAALVGETLGCFCKPRDCHGDVLVRLAKEVS